MASLAETARRSRRARQRRAVDYKWIALSNTTLGILMAAINGTILLISLPAIFRGIRVNPFVSGQMSLLLWVLMSFNVATTVLLVTFGRLSDSYGRVRLYNLGFAIFTLGSILCFLTPGKGLAGEWELIVFRFIQGIGGAFLFANSAAILTDAFPPDERGLALGLNQVAGIGGSVIGLVLGGLLAAWDWRVVFLVNVPIGIIGTIWAYVALREEASRRYSPRLDLLGNLTFGIGLLAILVGLTYGIVPYSGAAMGWGNPLVIGCLIGGVVLLGLFVLVERRARDPMFHLELFRNRAFAAGNLAGFLAAVARGGLQFMIIIWLQGIWLPLHGVSFADTPLQAGIDTLPQMAGFLLAGPISGRLSDRYGARWFGFAGMVVSALGFLWLTRLPANFAYGSFAAAIFLIGLGMGMFASPNATAIMNAVPPSVRGVASGMRVTFQNAGMMMSMGVFFTIVVTGLSHNLPAALRHGLAGYGLPPALVQAFSHLPAEGALFAALLGLNPVAQLLPPAVLHLLPPARAAHLVSRDFFPMLISHPFMAALRTVFTFSIALSLVSALASLLRGRRYVWDEDRKRATPARGPGSRAWLAFALLNALDAGRRLAERPGPANRARAQRAAVFLAFNLDPPALARWRFRAVDGAHPRASACQLGEKGGESRSGLLDEPLPHAKSPLGR